jgi:hypothetical protein
MAITKWSIPSSEKERKGPSAAFCRAGSLSLVGIMCLITRLTAAWSPRTSPARPTSESFLGNKLAEVDGRAWGAYVAASGQVHRLFPGFDRGQDRLGSKRSARRFSTISTAAGGSWCNPDQWRGWDDWVASELVSAASAGLANASPSQSVRMIKTIGAITVVVPRNFIASS